MREIKLPGYSFEYDPAAAAEEQRARKARLAGRHTQRPPEPVIKPEPVLVRAAPVEVPQAKSAPVPVVKITPTVTPPTPTTPALEVFTFRDELEILKEESGRIEERMEQLIELHPELTPLVNNTEGTTLPRLKIVDIQKAVCQHFDMDLKLFLSESRKKKLVYARSVAMYLARMLTDKSMLFIGRLMGNRDHTTVLHAVKKTQSRILTDEGLRQDVKEVLRILRREDLVDKVIIEAAPD